MRMLKNRRGKAGNGQDSVRKSARKIECRGRRWQAIATYVANDSIAGKGQIRLTLCVINTRLSVIAVVMQGASCGRDFMINLIFRFRRYRYISGLSA
ncbi:hypothetical protein Nmul_A1409 [Nitrosospira multiformis ATCC 25196]|uniref:Uncharacterized protein n=2 Tax=Nitrosospira multiformis (strain ATCC 25196 / NCIMB 11849 / C 71) TaxID=323848 RepID=Q2Y959_NITMU|nr:hypothetical protein Nmul_A1409 [Nitrosospira multiformis ATCC 25196]